MRFAIERYRPEHAADWDAFVRASRNGTFLLERGFMDYHADRFTDHSLLVREQGALVAVMPANRRGDTLCSHGGLTYGGLVYGDKAGAADVLEMLQAIGAGLAAEGIARLSYKTIPWIYHRHPAEDDRYALFRLGAELSRRDVLSVVARDDRLAFQQRRTRGIRAAERAGVEVAESSDFAAYWAVLEGVLQERHGVAPVHSREEIELLRARFPDRIRLFTARVAGETAAGAVIFETPRVAHVQYIAASHAGRECSALDAVFNVLLNDVYREKAYFDFGISNEAEGTVLNRGLVEQKEGFGARAVAHDHYLLRLDPSDVH